MLLYLSLVGRRGECQGRLDGWSRWRADRAATCNLWLFHYERSDAVGSSVAVVGRLLPTHDAGHRNSQPASRAGRIGVLVRSGHTHGFTWCDAEGQLLECYIQRTVGTDGFDFLCCLVSRVDSRHRQLFKGQLLDWFRMWKVGVQLGPIDVFPP